MEYVGNIIYDEYLFEDRRFIIYGIGVNGRKIYDYLKNNGKEKNILAFCDKAISNGNLNNKMVISPSDAVKIDNVDFLVSGKYEYEMVEYLVSNSITKIHILSF